MAAALRENDGLRTLLAGLALAQRVLARLLPSGMAERRHLAPLPVGANRLLGRDVDIPSLQHDAPLCANGPAVVKPLVLEVHVVRARADPRPRNQLALGVAVCAQGTMDGGDGVSERLPGSEPRTRAAGSGRVPRTPADAALARVVVVVQLADEWRGGAKQLGERHAQLVCRRVVFEVDHLRRGQVR